MSLIPALRRLIDEVSGVVSEALNSAFPLLDLYVDSFMNLGMRPKAGNFTDKVYVNTGKLKRSFSIGASESIQELTVNNSGIVLRFGTTVPYAIFNEKGTRHIQARPFLDPAIEAYFDDDIADLQDVIENKLRLIFK